MQTLGVKVLSSELFGTCFTAYQATRSVRTANVNTTTSKTTMPMFEAKGTKKSTNPIGNAMRNNRFLWKMTDMKHK